jgi:hypothetical protein
MLRNSALITAVTALILTGAIAAAGPASGKSSAPKQAILTSSATRPATSLGYSVAVSGRTVVVGAPDTVTGAGGGQGAVYVYTEPKHGGWRNATQTAVLTVAGDPAGENGGLGESVAISGSTIFATDPQSADLDGAVYAFNKPSGGWRSTSHPSATMRPTAHIYYYVGYGLAVSGGTVAVEATEPTGLFVGHPAALIFTRPTGGWKGNVTQKAALVRPDVSYWGESLGIAVSATTVVIGCSELDTSSGTPPAFVYTRPTTGWTTTDTPTATLTSGAAGYDGFGSSAALSGSHVLVGAPGSDGGSPNVRGAVYVFNEPTGGWSAAADPASPAGKFTDPGEKLADADGFALAVSGRTLVVGAESRTQGSHLYVGATYLFTEPASGWTHAKETARLTPPHVQTGDFYGEAVAVSGSTVVIGASGAADNEGTAYAARS